MAKGRRIPAPRSRLGLFERLALTRSGKLDGADKRFKLVDVDTDLSVHISTFMSSELENFFSFRDDVFEYLIITLDCHNLDYDLVDCDEKPTCKQEKCKKCRRFFAETITEINQEINSLIATLNVVDPQFESEKKTLTEKLTTNNIPPQLKLKYQSQIQEIDRMILANRDKARQKLMNCIHSKIRLIEAVHKLLAAHFRIRVLRLKHYWKAARVQYRELPPILPSDGVLIELCHQIFLGAFEKEYNTAIEQQKKYGNAKS